MKNTKKSLLVSVLSLMLCVAMLLGTTYAWFTDSVTSGKNTIVAGNLDVELYHKSANGTEEEVTSTTENLFKDVAKWEPGAYAYETFTVKNVGDLALKYSMRLNASNATKTMVNGDEHDLTEVLKVKVVDAAPTSRPAYTDGEALKDWVLDKDNSVLYPTQVSDTPHEESFTVVIYWEPGENDNWFNLNNERKGDTPLSVDVNVVLEARQYTYEEDSFDKFYDLLDEDVILPDWSGESDEVAVTDDTGATMQVKVGDDVRATATVDAGTKIKAAGESTAKSLEENEKLKLTIEPDNTPSGIKVELSQSVTTYDVSLIKVVTTTEESGGQKKTDVRVAEADKPVLVSLEIGVVDLQAFYHHGQKLTKVNSVGDIDVEGKYYYDVNDGMVYFKTKSFSPFASVYKFAGGLGTEDHQYKIANGNHLLAISDELAETESDKVYFILNNDINVTDYKYSGWFVNNCDTPTAFDFDLNQKTISNVYGSLFYSNQADAKIHNGKIETIEAGTVIDDYGTTSHSVELSDLIVVGNRDNTSDYYDGCLSCYMGNTNNGSSCVDVTVRNVKTYVTMKTGGSNAAVGGLFGYSLNTSMTFENVEVYNNISGTTSAGGFLSGASQSCGYNTTNGKGIKSVTNCKFYGTIVVPENKTGYYFGYTGGDYNEQVRTDDATIYNSIAISDFITIPDGYGDTIKIANDSTKGYTKYLVTLSFATDLVNGQAGGYPKTITKIIDNPTGEVIDTELKKLLLKEGTYENGYIDHGNSIYESSDYYVYDGNGELKLSPGMNVSIKVCAYVNDDIKAVGTASYIAK